MGFPRILSKNNKIYTKLGEFCLSSDGNQFYIVCHTCQQELQTQDNFWKHIQDEHSFMHELKRDSPTDPSRHQNQGFMDSSTAVVVDVPQPIAALVSNYREVNIKAERGLIAQNDVGEEEEEEQEPKDYTEMRVIEPSAVEVNIKVEQPHMGSTEVAAQQLQQAAPTLYIPPTATAAGMPPHIMSYASMLQNMPQVCTVIPPSAGLSVPAPDPPKDSSSATSEDGERWYICDYHSCAMKFKYQSRLELHRSVHSKVRRFVCELCNASFKQSCNLSTHRKKKHNVRAVRMVKCDST